MKDGYEPDLGDGRRPDRHAAACRRDEPHAHERRKFGLGREIDRLGAAKRQFTRQRRVQYRNESRRHGVALLAPSRTAALTSFTPSSLAHSAGPAILPISQPERSTITVVGMPKALPAIFRSSNTRAL